MKTITVIPLDWKNNGDYNYLANALTQSLIFGVKQVKKYEYLSPYLLRNMDKDNYWKIVDVYIEAEILNVSKQDKYESIKESDDEKPKSYTIRTVTVNVRYKYIRAKDNEVIGDFNRIGFSSNRFRNTIIDLIFTGHFGIEGIYKSEETMAKDIVSTFHKMMDKDLRPFKITETKVLFENVNNNPDFKIANAFVKQKKYSEAITVYKKAYEETGDIYACYNAVILLQANNQLIEALELAEILNEYISRNRLSSRFNILREIEFLKEIIGK
jgi:tetratricopeptide (TPR) repeat protein